MRWCLGCHNWETDCKCLARGRVPQLAQAHSALHGLSEPTDASHGRSAGFVAGGGALLGPRDVKVSIIRGDGLSVERILTGDQLEKLRWPDIFVRNIFDIMLQEFRRTEKEN